MTQEDTSAVYPQHAYNAILKAATGKNITFNVQNSPFPVEERIKNKGKKLSGVFIVFVICTAFAVIPAAAVHFVTVEKEQNLRH